MSAVRKSVAMDVADVIIFRRYYELNHRASSLNSRVRLIRMITSDSI
jgi:hypothetical protein